MAAQTKSRDALVAEARQSKGEGKGRSEAKAVVEEYTDATETESIIAEVYGKGAGAGGERRVRSRKASAIQMEKIAWLWGPGWVPMSHLSLILGEEDMGKTNIWVERVARATRGELPGDFHGEPITVLIVSIEDDPASVLVPRLVAAEADLERVEFITVTIGDDTDDVGLRLPEDADALGEHAARIGATWIIIDPLTTFLEGDIDTHREADIKQALAPLQRIAERHRLAVTGVHHFNKSTSTSERQRVSGSGALRTSARATAVVGLDKDDPNGANGDSRVITLGKHNYTRGQQAFRVRLENASVAMETGETIQTSKAVFGETCDHTTHDVLGALAAHQGGEKLQEAKAFLTGELRDGPKDVKDVKASAEADGIALGTLERARRALQIDTVLPTTKGGPWRWKLPERTGLGMS